MQVFLCLCRSFQFNEINIGTYVLISDLGYFSTLLLALFVVKPNNLIHKNASLLLPDLVKRQTKSQILENLYTIFGLIMQNPVNVLLIQIADTKFQEKCIDEQNINIWSKPRQNFIFKHKQNTLCANPN